MVLRDGLELFFGAARQRLGVVQQGPEDSEFRKHDHLHPRIQMHGEIDPLAHMIQVGTVSQEHLDTGDREWRHDASSFRRGNNLASDS